jgi:hypothetical protein
MNNTTLRLSITLLLAAGAQAQFDTATVLGTVRDSSRSALVGASVSLVNTATGVAQTTLSNEAGDYQFFNVKSAGTR